MMTDTDGLVELLLLAAFLICLLPPLVSTVTGIACGMALPNGSAGWGVAFGLGLGVAGAVINIAGLIVLIGFLDVDPTHWAQEIFCEKPLHLINNRHNSYCYPAMTWAPRIFWIGISLVTPAAAAAAGTWWLCRWRSMNLR
jgi:hypothetical protein